MRESKSREMMTDTRPTPRSQGTSRIRCLQDDGSYAEPAIHVPNVAIRSRAIGRAHFMYMKIVRGSILQGDDVVVVLISSIEVDVS